ncbi:MAG: hypothetical protein ACTTJS_04665 [Wolinella sp.]
MIVKNLRFAGTLYPSTCAEMRLYLDKVKQNISSALEDCTHNQRILTLSDDNFENIAHDALFGLLQIAKNGTIKHIFIFSPLIDSCLDSEYKEESLLRCDAESYTLLAREIPALSDNELTIMPTLANLRTLSSTISTPKSEILLPIVSYAFREREISLCELFFSDINVVIPIIEEILKDETSMILVLKES